MSLWSKLFGGGARGGAEAEVVEYKGYRIIPEPIKEAGGHRIAASIEKEIGGAVKRHQFIRADVCNSLYEATGTSVTKAKSLIDQQGEAIFD